MLHLHLGLKALKEHRSYGVCLWDPLNDPTYQPEPKTRDKGEDRLNGRRRRRPQPRIFRPGGLEPVSREVSQDSGEAGNSWSPGFQGDQRGADEQGPPTQTPGSGSRKKGPD